LITPKVYCKRIIFQDSVPANEVNYFNKNASALSGIDQKYEITDVIDISTIKYDHSKVLSGDTLDLIKKCSNVNITIGTIQNSYADYFHVKSTLKRYLYVFWVVWDNVTIFTGATNQEGIKYNEDTSPSSEQIKIEVKSMLNHFLDYNRTQYCNITEMEPYFNLLMDVSGGISTSEFRSTYLQGFLSQLFKCNFNLTTINNTGRDWEINRQPYFHVTSDNVYHFIPNGFRKIGAPTGTGYDGEIIGQYETKTGFFVKLCNAMGWEFELKGNYTNELTTLTISNRYAPTLAITASSEDIADINYNTEFDNSLVDYIVIRDGQVTADVGIHNGSNTIPIKIISLYSTYSNNGYFFKSAYNETAIWKLRTYGSGEYYLASNTVSEGDYLDFGKISYYSSSFFGRTTLRNRIDNNFILYIDAGENTKGSAVNLFSKGQVLDADTIGNITRGFWYKGSYGSMLFYRESGYYRNYDDYSKTDTFRNNFKTLLKNKDSDTIEVTWNKLFTDYYGGNYSQIVLNDSNSYLNTTWNITELELDLKAEQTKMKLKRAA